MKLCVTRIKKDMTLNLSLTPILLIVAVVLLLVGAGLWWYHCSKKKNNNSKATSTASVSQGGVTSTSSPTTGSRFQGKVVLVTGGTSGIGLAAATAFAQEGAVVVVCGRTPSKWQQADVPAQLKANMDYQQTDVRVESEVQNLITYIVSKYGSLDIAVNAAGVAPSGPLGQTVVESGTRKTGSIWYGIGQPQPKSKCASSDPPTCDNSQCPVGQQTGASSFCENPVFTDGMGIFYCLKWQCTQMAKQANKGCIVNVASINSIWGSVGGVLYGAAKGMCLLLTRGAAGEQAGNGIRINCISPGAVFTPLLSTQFGSGQQSYQAVNKIMKESIPLGRLAMPTDMVGPILFLADSTQSGYLTGTNLVCDGGMTAAPLLQVPCS